MNNVMIWICVLIGIALVWIGGLWFLRKIWFYRNPNRQPEDVNQTIIAPADGRIVYIKPFADGMITAEKLGEPIPLTEIAGFDVPRKNGWAIGVYMSPLDVHYNFCPYPGIVKRIVHKKAKLNLPMLDVWEYLRVVWLKKMVNMFARRYHLENERNTILIEGKSATMAVVLIADKFVDKITCFVQPEQAIDYSEKIGFIERGSQVDLIIFADNVTFNVEINQQVYGGQTVIGRFTD